MKSSYLIFVGFFVLSTSLLNDKISAQNLPAISEISYSLIDGELIPTYKRNFKYLDDQTLLETIEFQNSSTLRNPRWKPTRNRTNIFDNTGRNVGSRTIFYFQNNNRNQISSISESFSTYNDQGLQTKSQFVYTQFDESGDVAYFDASRYTSLYDDNQCEIELIIEQNEDSDLKEQNWRKTSHTFFEHDRQCELISSESYSDGILNSTYRSEKNELGQITLRESIHGHSDSSNLYQQIDRFEYNVRGQLIYFDRLNIDPSVTYRFEYFYSYNRAGLEDTTITKFTLDTAVTRSLEALEYDRFRNLTKSETFRYDSLNNLYRVYAFEGVYDDKNRITTSISEGCELGGFCRKFRTETSYREDDQLEKRITYAVETLNGEVANEWTDSGDYIYNCAGQLIEQTFSENDVVTSKTENIYPLSPECEIISRESDIRIIPNPAINDISVITRFLNGQNTEVNIYTPSGIKVFTSSTDAEFFYNTPDLNLSTGKYILQMVRGETSLAEQLIVVNE